MKIADFNLRDSCRVNQLPPDAGVDSGVDSPGFAAVAAVGVLESLLLVGLDAAGVAELGALETALTLVLDAGREGAGWEGAGGIATEDCLEPSLLPLSKVILWIPLG